MERGRINHGGRELDPRCKEKAVAWYIEFWNVILSEHVYMRWRLEAFNGAGGIGMGKHCINTGPFCTSRYYI